MKKDILFVGTLPPPYHGVAVANKILLDSKYAKNHNIYVVDNSLGKKLSDVGRLSFNNAAAFVVYFFKYSFHLITKKPELLYLPISQNKKAFVRDSIFIDIAKLFNKKILLHLHGSYFKEFYKQSGEVFKRYIEHTLKNIDGMIVLGNSLKYIFEGLIPEEKIYVVENGIDIPDCKKQINVNKTGKRVLFLGNLKESKGIYDVLKAVPEVISKNKDSVFTFVGGWDKNKEKTGEEVEKLIKELKIPQENIEFTGPLISDDKNEILNNSDVFVFPALNEGLPLVILEALAFGLPIITTDAGCIEEVVKDGENGFIVDKHDVKAIAGYINLLFDNEELRMKISRNNIEKYKNNYMACHFSRRFFNVLEEILDSEKKGKENIFDFEEDIDETAASKYTDR